MFSMLPDLTPGDHHLLWYTSSRNPVVASTSHQNNHDPSSQDALQNTNSGHSNRRAGHGALERTPLARLRADEQYMERRRLNVSNFGTTWLKPPGVPKSLFQMREERREAEEHDEAVRRELVAQELAEAEAESAAEMAITDLDGDDAMEDEDDEDGMQDLDDEIPEAEGFGFDGEDSEEEEEEEEEEGESDDEEEEADDVTDVRNIRATEDRVRELMVRGPEGDSDVYGDEGEEVEDGSQMLEEDDLVQMSHDVMDVELGGDMDMEADLDGDIPEANDGYEHTDSDASLDSHDVSYAARAPQAQRVRRSLPRSSIRSNQRVSLAPSDIDISSLLSRDGSSFVGSSPQLRRRN